MAALKKIMMISIFWVPFAWAAPQMDEDEESFDEAPLTNPGESAAPASATPPPATAPQPAAAPQPATSPEATAPAEGAKAPATPPPPAATKKATPPPSSPRARAAATSRLGELNLTPEQTAAIVAMRKQWKDDQEGQIKNNLREAKRLLYEAMSDTSDAAEVKKRFEEVQKHYIALQAIKFEKSLKIREILSPDQRRKFQELRTRSSNETK